jgi:hypothetical protein
MEGIVLEEKKYIWINHSDQTGQDLYCYLNENGEKVYGNIVTTSPSGHPYSKHSAHKSAECKGEAVTFVECHRKGDLIK